MESDGERIIASELTLGGGVGVGAGNGGGDGGVMIAGGGVDCELGGIYADCVVKAVVAPRWIPEGFCATDR